jgi:pimeloyl-ACP methyl ester carboxylesterase
LPGTGIAAKILTMSAATLVLVPPAGCGAWAWEAVGEELNRLGIVHHAIDPPSLGSAPPPDAGIRQDAGVVRSILDDLARPVVLVGNSYGGFVISAAAVDHPAVARLVYVAAFMPEPGVPAFEQLVTTDEFSAALTMTDDGLGSFDPDRAPAIVFHQADPEIAERAAIRMQPQRLSDIGAALPAVAWQGIPSTYVVCTEDRSIPPDYQEMCATQRATTKMEMQWDHVPALSHPTELAQILAGISAEVTSS